MISTINSDCQSDIYVGVSKSPKKYGNQNPWNFWEPTFQQETWGIFFSGHHYQRLKIIVEFDQKVNIATILAVMQATIKGEGTQRWKQKHN